MPDFKCLANATKSLASHLDKYTRCGNWLLVPGAVGSAYGASQNFLTELLRC